MSQEQKNDASSEETDAAAEDAGLWTPPEKLDTNTQRMTWTLFLEEWKSDEPLHKTKTLAEWAKETYESCLEVAKVVRAAELEAGGQ